MNEFSDIVILCVGTDKLIGDLVGPIAGQKLKRLFKDFEKITVYGDIKKTVNTTNLNAIISEIIANYDQPFIITIDSALGPREKIETVWVSTGNLNPGSALKKQKSCRSNVNFKAVVGENLQNTILNFNVLNSIERNVVQRLANEITYHVYKMCINLI